jgi:hypothetical protein
MRETGGAFGSQEAAVRAVESSYRGRAGDIKDVLARQDSRLSFRQGQAESPHILLVEVFPNDVSHGEPLATYKVMEGSRRKLTRPMRIRHPPTKDILGNWTPCSKSQSMPHKI